MNKWNQKCRRKPKKIGRSRTGIRRKYVENFIICGLTGWGLEILLTSAESLAAGDWKIFTVSLLSIVIFPSALSPTFSTLTVSGTDTLVLHPARETAIMADNPIAVNILFFILIPPLLQTSA